MKNHIRIGWVISGDYSVASSRLQGFYIHEYLKTKGLYSEILSTNFNETWESYSISFLRLARQIFKKHLDIVFFERPNWMMFKLSSILRAQGVRTIAVRCDPLPNPHDLDTHFDTTIVPSIILGKLLDIKKFIAIDDMIEVPDQIYKRDYKKQNTTLRIAWVGHPLYRDFITQFFSDLEQIYTAGDIQPVTISRGPWATHKWSLDNVFDDILSCDIAIIPMPQEAHFLAKSSNRLTMFMALGMPTIASPIPSYESIAKNGDTCLLADSTHDFAKALSTLQNENERRCIGKAARHYAQAHFSPRIIGPKWLDVINNIHSSSTDFPNSDISVSTKILSNILCV